MKNLLLASLLLPALCTAQFVLIDRSMKAPIVVTDSITTNDLIKGWFPINVNDVDSVIKILTKLQKFIDNTKSLKAGTIVFDLRYSDIICLVQKQVFSHGYHLVINTDIDNLGTSMSLLNKNEGRIRALQKLSNFLDYLRNNISILKGDKM